MEQIEVLIWSKPSDFVENVKLSFDVADNGLIELAGYGSKRLIAKEGDLFSSFIQIRKDLERKNQFVLCNGSRIDVVPSRMSRQMGGARLVYQITIGKQAFSSDLVDLFAPADKECMATVAEQNEYYKSWIASLL